MVLDLRSNQEVKSSKLRRKNKTPVVSKSNLERKKPCHFRVQRREEKNQGTKTIVKPRPAENQYLAVGTTEQQEQRSHRVRSGLSQVDSDHVKHNNP